MLGNGSEEIIKGAGVNLTSESEAWWIYTPNGFGTRWERFSVKANPFVCLKCTRIYPPLPYNCKKQCSVLAQIPFHCLCDMFYKISILGQLYPIFSNWKSMNVSSTELLEKDNRASFEGKRGLCRSVQSGAEWHLVNCKKCEKGEAQVWYLLFITRQYFFLNFYLIVAEKQ